MKAEIICVGTELLLGDVVNTNATFIAQELAGIGVDVYYQSVVGDNKTRLTDVLNRSVNNSDVVILSGGLGPTCDDLTKETVSDFFGLRLKLDEEVLQHIKDIFLAKGYSMTENNKKQAFVPEDAIVIKNYNGTAPGIIIEKGSKIIILLPGPPSELEPMMRNQIVPYLKKKSEKIFVSRNIHVFGIGESKVEEKLCNLMERLNNPTLAPYAKEGEVLLRVTCSAHSKEEALKKINPIIDQVKNRLGEEFIYGIDVDSLENAVVKKLIGKNLRLATAESCTGGLISKRITDIAGSSKIFNLGVCSYSNDMKCKILGVREETIKNFGAVSPETALEMAKGIRKISGSDIGISSTGIAGPGGGSAEKPVGLVYVGFDGMGVSRVRKLNLGSCFKNERESIRYIASSHALHLILENL